MIGFARDSTLASGNIMRMGSTMLSFRTRGIAPFVIVALLARPSSARRPGTARSQQVVAGCYHVTLGPWSKKSRLGPDQPTAIIRLDTITRRPGAPGELAAERIEPAEFAPPGDPRLRWRRPASWHRVDGDSVVIVAWSTGTEAEVFYGRWTGGSLHGVVRRTSDAIPVDPLTGRIQWNVWPWATASLVGVPCPVK
jgi:hypothetical protein